jgi:putative ABC transport system permease protein
MGRSNIPLLNTASIYSPFIHSFRSFIDSLGVETLSRMASNLFIILYVGGLVLLVKLAFDWLMRTDVGLSMRATGDNPQMIRSLGTSTRMIVIIGLAISNGLASLSGAIVAQYQGFADINMGTGIIIAGLAAVILGETIFRPKSIAGASAAVIAGMILYRLVIAAALSIGIPLPGGITLRVEPQDVKLATAILVIAVLTITYFRKRKLDAPNPGVNESF